MRPIERINNFLKLVNWRKLNERWEINPMHYEAVNTLINDPTVYTTFISYWKENPDQRVGQVLINLNLLSYSIIRWYDEESDILIDQGIPPEECLYWTSHFDKEGNRLYKPITRLVKDLTPDHINKILQLFSPRLSEEYKKAFNNVLAKSI